LALTEPDIPPPEGSMSLHIKPEVVYRNYQGLTNGKQFYHDVECS